MRGKRLAEQGSDLKSVKFKLTHYPTISPVDKKSVDS